jgi:hypothetical protein
MDNCDRNPKVSLIIPNLNGKNLLRECLNSLKKLKYTNFEVIVVDGGSTDGTPEMVKVEFPEVKLIVEEGAGIGRAINLGLNMAEGEIIGFDLNNDEIFKEDWLKKLIDVLLSSPDIGVVGGTRLIYGRDKLVDEGGVKFNYFGIAWSNIRLGLDELPCEPIEVDYVGIPLVWRWIVDMVGGCDETYGIYFEDSDFCFKVKRLGLKVIWVPQAISYHRRSSTIPKLSDRVTFLKIRNRFRFLLIHFSLPRLVSSFLYEVILFLSRIILSRFISPQTRNSSKYSRLSFLHVPKPYRYLRATVKAVLWNLENFKETLQARRQISYRSKAYRNEVGMKIDKRRHELFRKCSYNNS